MTIDESVNVFLKQPSRYKEVSGFSKSFRTDDLGNIEPGEEFTIPENYRVLSQSMWRDGKPVTDREGNPVTAEFIVCKTNKGRNINFFPSSVCKVVFAVDENTGKDLTGANRIVRSSGDLAEYCKANRDMDKTMQALKGCTVKLMSAKKIAARKFGVSNQDATKDDVYYNTVGEWTLVGDKRPENWTVA